MGSLKVLIFNHWLFNKMIYVKGIILSRALFWILNKFFPHTFTITIYLQLIGRSLSLEFGALGWVAKYITWTSKFGISHFRLDFWGLMTRVGLDWDLKLELRLVNNIIILKYLNPKRSNSTIPRLLCSLKILDI